MVSNRPPMPPVLLVGEDPQVRDLFGHLLELRGHTVLGAATIDEAIARCRDEGVAVVVIENMEHGATWTPLPRALGEALGAGSPPVVMLTGSWGSSDPDASQPGVLPLIAPHRAEQLLDVVARYCQGLRGRTP